MKTALLAIAILIGLSLWPVHAPVEAQGGLIVLATSADITGTNAAVQVASSGTARWIQVVALTTNSNPIRCGDSAVTATRGVPVAAGGGFMLPPMPADDRQAVNQHYYSLSGTYCYVTTGDKVSFTWGN